jgi:hypothetical protein
VPTSRAAKYAADEADRASLTRLTAALDSPPARDLRRPAEDPEEEAAGERPHLARPAAEQAAGGDSPAGEPQTLGRGAYRTVEGTLEQLDCLEDVGRIRVGVAGRAVQFLMEDPQAIEIWGVQTGKVTFECGPQKPRRVLIEYEPSVDGKLGTTGVVRAIEFK